MSTITDPLAIWADLTAAQQKTLSRYREHGFAERFHLRRDPTWTSLERRHLARWAPLACHWFPTTLGRQVAEPPVLFLDNDGVIARVIFRPRLPGETEEQWQGRQATADERLDATAVRRLNRIVHATGARFVSCSTWREGREPKKAAAQITAWMRAKGFEGEVVDATPVLGVGGVRREDEIEAWLAAQPVPPRAFAILDDWPMRRPTLAPRAVQTDYDALVTEGDVDRVIELLSPPARRGRGRGATAAPEGATT